MIKLAAFDVDGTIREREFMPESTRAAIKRLQDSGIITVLCTGRSEFEMRPLREELGIDWAITCNGNHIGYRGDTRHGRPFEAGEVQRWIETAGTNGHALVLYGGGSMWMNRADDVWFRQAQRDIGFMQPLPLPADNRLPDIYQCIVFCDAAADPLYFDRASDSYYVHRFAPYATDINPQGTNKAAGLMRLLGELGISPDEAAAFGDGSNDIEMLGAVGCGIAMGNGIDAAKRAARHITKPLREDGIAYAVDAWILGASS